jgi:hypothetical protein
VEFTADDEYMHQPTDHPQFNESMYFNFVDGASDFAMLVRMGNRVNEGFAEVTVLLYLPGGRAAFHFERAPIVGNDAFAAAGLRFEIVEPLKRSRVTFSGEVRVMEHGTELEDPKKVFSSNPVQHLELVLDVEDAIPVYGLGSSGSGSSGIAGAEDSIATGHYQGPTLVRGTVTLDGDEQSISGTGYRDHSWGPRIWQGPAYWRWVSGLVDARNGFVGWVSKIDGERAPDRGMVLHDGEVSMVERIDITSTYGPPPHYPETMQLTLHTADRSFEVEGEATALVPLRNRRHGEVARLAELVCRYEFEGRTAYGISEYHDRMIDGVPAGLHEV